LDKHKQVLSEHELYEEYMANYVNWMHDTKGINKNLMKPSFLNKNLKQQEKRSSSALFVRPELRYKIQQESYHMYYIVGSEDVFYRSSSQAKNSSKRDTSKWDQLLSINHHLMQEHLYK
jgi:paired amphipathic helix protein Sin3a